MGGGHAAKDHPIEYFSASTFAAIINYPLWRAAALSQSGFKLAFNPNRASVPSSLAPYLYAFSPPYKGLGATVIGMSWARAAIFYGSDRGKEILLSNGMSNTMATVIPPLFVSTAVQCINMPIVKATILLQNPQSDVPNIRESFKLIKKNTRNQRLVAWNLRRGSQNCAQILYRNFCERLHGKKYATGGRGQPYKR